MGAIKVFLFGKFRIEVDTALVQKFDPYKAKELMVYLLLNRDRPQYREQLAEVLWGEIAPEQSKGYLRKALWQLQSVLEPHCGEGILLVDGEWLQINPDFHFWLDIDAFEQTFKNTQGVRGKDLEEGQAIRIEDAVNTYQGDLLEGWYQDWCLYERERLQYLYLAMLDKLMDRCEVQEHYESGLMFGEKILQYDRARERTHRRLMRLYYLAGDRTAALRQYRKCMAVLQKELDVEPATSTRQLYEMIRTDTLENLEYTNAFPETKTDSVESDPLRVVFGHLSAFHKELTRIQKQLTQDMQSIQRTIDGD